MGYPKTIDIRPKIIKESIKPIIVWRGKSNNFCDGTLQGKKRG